MRTGEVRKQRVPMEAVYPITIGPDYKFIRTDWFYRVYSSIVYSFFIVFVGWLFFGIIGRHRICGRKRLRSLKKKGFITVANHCHLFDTVITGKALFPRKAWYASVQRNFEAPVYRKLFPMLQGFPIPDGVMGLRRIMEPVVEAVHQGKIVHFFPEEELWHLYQGIDYFQRGSFYLAHLANCPVVPMVHLFKPRTFFGRQVSKNILTIKTIVGDPVYPDVPSEDGEKVDLDSVTRMTDTIRQWMKDEMAKYHGREV
jgi:1-acyl-sn-glycerol-3-phosphate acyltransferase